jgi:hypothetical protein
MRRIDPSAFDTKLCASIGCPEEVDRDSPTEGPQAGLCLECRRVESFTARVRQQMAEDDGLATLQARLGIEK